MAWALSSSLHFLLMFKCFRLSSHHPTARPTVTVRINSSRMVKRNMAGALDLIVMRRYGALMYRPALLHHQSSACCTRPLVAHASDRGRLIGAGSSCGDA